jgi:hypothetical protein
LSILVAEMRVSMDHQVDAMIVNHATEDRIAEHPVLEGRFLAKRGDSRRIVHDDDDRIRFLESQLVERGLEPKRFAPCPDADGLAEAGGYQVRLLLRPKPTAIATNTGQPNFPAVRANVDHRAAIEQPYPGPFEQ